MKQSEPLWPNQLRKHQLAFEEKIQQETGTEK